MQAAEEEKSLIGVKILGGGCAKCNQLEAATIDALSELGMDTTIDHVKDYEKIAAYGVMTTPALVVDGKVVSYGLPTDYLRITCQLPTVSLFMRFLMCYIYNGQSERETNPESQAHFFCKRIPADLSVSL